MRTALRVVCVCLGAAWVTPVARIASAQADARQAIVSVTVSADSVTVGEPFTVRLRVRAPKVATIRFPDVPEPSGGVDPIDPRALENGPPGDLLDQTAVYSFVAWDIGKRGPALGPVIVSVAGQERQVGFPAPTVVVRSLLPADTADQKPRDARSPVALLGRIWQLVVVGVIALAIAAILWIRWRRRRRAQSVAEEAEPWHEARDAFANLDELGLGEAGEPGRLVIAHVDVLRQYIGRRFPSVDGPLEGSTSTAMLGKADFPILPERVTALLERDEAVRYAQAVVTGEEAVVLAAEARDIVAKVQLAHEARLRAREQPMKPRRR